VKGVVFNLLEQVVSRDYGEDTWDQLLDAAGVDGAYTSLGGYADADLFALVGAASTALDKPPDEIVRWFGREALPLLAANYPQFFEAHQSTRPFILTLNEIIHPEVRKLYPGADVPVFDFDVTNEALLMGYRSDRQLCSFAEGLIEGAADHYGEKASIEQHTCMKRGDPKCLLEISFEAG
jgi:predicted hydrocarbon binding protein